MYRLPKLINHLTWSRSRICPGRSPGFAPTLLVLALLAILLPACITLIQERSEREGPVEALVRPAQAQKANPALTDNGETGPASPVQQAGPQSPAGALLPLWTKAGSELHLVDPHTGKDLSGYEPIEVGRNLGLAALSPNRATLAAISHPATTACGVTGCQLPGTTLHLVELSTWNEAPIDLAGPAKVPTVPANFFAFSPDESVLAVTYAGPSPLHAPPEGGTSASLPGSSIEKVKAPGAYWLATIDLTAQTITNQIPLDVAPRFLAYTPDAGSLVLYGVPYPAWTSDSPDKNVVKPGTSRVSLIKAADLSLEWEAELPGLLEGQLWQETGNSPAGAFWQPAVVFAPGRGALHIVHANEEKLTTVDLAQRTLHTVEISPKQSWFERLLALTAGVAQAKMVEGTTKRAVLSGDESRLYVVGVAHETGESLGLQVIEAENGAEIARLDTQATEIGIWPSKEQLYLYGWDEAGSWTEVLDAQRLEPASARLEGHVVPTQLLDGQSILLARNLDQKATHLAALDAESFKVIQAWSVDGYVAWVSAIAR